MSVFVISDLHLGHKNIIRYCDRPFNSVSEMDEKLIRNWNRKVGPQDTVLYGGDLSLKSPTTGIEYVNRLNGEFVLLRGNHDGFDKWRTPFPVLEAEYFTYNHHGEKFTFYYSHWPEDYQEKTNRDDNRKEPAYSKPPEWFDGFNIHGHVHNNDVDAFPFVDFRERTVNVGADLLSFTPISLDELVEILKQEERYQTVEEVPNNVYTV